MTNWKHIVFTLAITFLFVPMVYLGVNTFFPESPSNTCYEKVPRPEAEFSEEHAIQMRECQDNWQKERTKHDGGKYITIIIICILASLVMLVPLDKSITYGLFLGVVVTAFTGTIRYLDSRSKAGFVLMVFLFGMVIYFIHRTASQKN